MAEFRTANQRLVELAQAEFSDFWASMNLSRDPYVVRDAVLEFMPALVTAYGDTAAVLGADWYDLLRDVPPSARAFDAVLADPPDVKQVEGSARWGLGPLFQDDPDTTLERLLGSTQRLVLQAGRDSVWRSAARDPVRTRVARVPSGADTCRFCIMLASRGAVYADDVAAGRGNDFHDNCDCTQVLVRSQADLPEGYNLDLYKRLYQERSGYGRDVPQGGILDTSTPMVRPS